MAKTASNNKHSETAYLLFGSNLGDRSAQLTEAAGKVAERAGRLIVLSSVYETEPWGFSHEIPFLNQAMSIQTPESPGRLLQILMSVEEEMGRVRKKGGYQARSLDIDILLYGLDIIGQHDLAIPHPLLCERRFALVPLEEIASGIMHPLMHKSIRELLQECNDTGWVRKLA